MTSDISVLIVDDEQVIREMLCEAIEGRGCSVTNVASARDAIVALNDQHFQVVITDIMMPEMDGFELIKYIRNNFPASVVVAITGYGTIEDAVRAIKEGTFDYVTKPFTLDQVRLVIEKAVRHYHLQQENKRLQKRLRRSEDLAFVGRLAAQVAHELNNPLDGALRFVNLTLKQIEPDNTLAQYQNEVRSGLLRMANIVQSLLEYSRNSAAMDAPDDIHSMLQGAIEQCGVSKDVEVRYELAAEAVIVAAGELSQVFINLIKNACDAMDNKGVLVIRTRLDSENIQIEIEDSGPGIPTELLDRIFFPFFTTKSAGKGTGLGLAVSSDIVQRCGGTINVRSEVSRGTTFTIQFPAGSTPLIAQPGPTG
jgi:signal transduction histidine kinase